MPSDAPGVPRVALVSLGCRVNRVELDRMARTLVAQGCELVGQREADAVVVNTCAVTGEAQAKTRKALRHAASLPQAPVVVATGCVASLFADELRAAVDGLVVEASKAEVPQRVLCELAARGLWSKEGRVAAGSGFASARTTPTGRTRPGIKIQDGCDNRCTYCIVWKARGASRSREPGAVLAQVREALADGAREVVLTGINLGAYRAVAPSGTLALPALLQLILRETDVERIRLSSIEPPDVTDELLEVMAQAGERVAPFLHVCLQAGCDHTLRQMGRVYDTAHFAQVVAHARAALPDLALGTDLIVGFPGESDDDFAQSLAFCEQMAFAKMHVFRYSKRPGTPAAARADQVAPEVAARRSTQMLELAARMRSEQAAQRVGREELVVVQHEGRGVTGGLFDALVDPQVPLDTLVRARVRSAASDGTLDCRT